MAFNGITPTQNSGFQPEIFLATALGRLRNYLTVTKVVTKDTDLGGGMFSVGQTLDLPKRGTLTVNDRNASGQYTTQSPQSSTIKLTLNQWKEVTFALDSAAIAFQNQDVTEGYIEDAIIALAEDIDKQIIQTIQAAGDAGMVTRLSSGAALSETNVLTARAKLTAGKVPFTQKKYGIVSSDNVTSLLGIDRFTRFDALGVSNNIADARVGNGIRDVSELDGAFGRLHGFEFAESQLLAAGEGSPSTSDSIFMAKTGVLFASRALPIPEAGTGALGTAMTDPDSGITMRLVKSWNPTYGAEQVTIDVLYGSTIMRPEHVYLVQTPY